MKDPRNIRAIRTIVRQVMAAGMLEQEQAEAIEKAMKRLDHALKTQDSDGTEDAVNALCRIFVRVNTR